MLVVIEQTSALSDVAHGLLERDVIEFGDRHRQQEFDAALQGQSNFMHRLLFALIGTLDVGRIGHAPVRRHRLAGPHRAHFASGLVADREDEIQRRRARLGELIPALAAIAVGRQMPARQLTQRERVHFALGMTAGRVGWISTIGYGCLTNWVKIGPDGLSPGETARCFATLVLTGVPLSLTLLIMLRHVARLAPAPVAMAASLAVSAMTAVALSLYHPLDATVMILMWNIGLTVILLIGSASYGSRLFRWIGAAV